MIGPESKPRLPRHVKLRHDAARDRWVVLAPEKIFSPNAVAIDVLRLCDGERTVSGISAELAKAYEAPADVIQNDVLKLLAGLAEKGVVEA